MRLLLCFIVFVVCAATPCTAQLTSDQKITVGSFYVSVDDSAKIFINGKESYVAPINESKSPELEIKTGDRIVVHLHNQTAGRRFLMTFAATDAKTVVSFRNQDFRIVPDLAVTDFTPDEFKRWKQAKQEKGRSNLPVKSYSEWVWGDTNDSILACIVTPQMVSQRPK